MKVQLGDKLKIIYSYDGGCKYMGVLETTLDVFYNRTDFFEGEVEIEDDDHIRIDDKDYIVYETYENYYGDGFHYVGITDIYYSLSINKDWLENSL